jgi:hypothetical protein
MRTKSNASWRSVSRSKLDGMNGGVERKFGSVIKEPRAL